MSFVSSSVRQFDRVTRSHALILLSACVTIVLFTFPPPPRFVINSITSESNRNESEVDSALQDAANNALGGREGTIIVMDPQTGRIRAVVNSEQAYGQALMPGSALKPFTALAALRAGLIDENSRTACPGRFTGLSFSLPCVHADHLPPFSPSQAIAYSCNYYFATLGQRLGRDALVETLRQFGFGQSTSVAGDEVSGLLRACETGFNARTRATENNHVSEQADCDAREAIGESDHIQVTPVQLLTAYAALINGGHLYEPKIAAAETFQPTERAVVNIANQHRAIVVEGMAGAIRYGTARSAKLDSLPLTIIGKTGTANPPKGFRTNGWFIGFAGSFQSSREIDPTQMNFAVLVLAARAHGSQAAEIAKPIFAAYANAVSGSNLSRKTENNQPNATVPTDNSAIRNQQSAIRVYLVHDNVTQELSLEDYVLGVMRAEGTMEDQPEALKALAIAIRTFALRNIGRHAKDGYDFCSTTHCQRFVRGKERGSSPTVREGVMVDAVRLTEGQVLLDDRGQLIDSYFGASCGGKTANIAELWGTNHVNYLISVHDEYCQSGPHASWSDAIAQADMLRALQSDPRTDVGSRLNNISVSKRDESGRAEFVTLEGEHRKVVRGWDFKIIVGRVLGWNVLKSSRFEVSRSGSNFVFRGSGFGHGLGLCQEGAHAMAERGAGYQKILEKYFPGTSIAKNDAATRGRGGTKTASIVGWKLDVLATAIPISASPSLLVSASRFLTISSEHFRVTYPSDVDRRDADQVLNALESSRAEYLRRVSSSLITMNIPTLDIRLNESTGDFTARTGQPWWAAAATKGNRIELQPLQILKQRGVLATTLRHELAHAVIDAINHNRGPRWLEEGFAIYLAGEGPTILRYAAKRKLADDELERRLERPGSQQEMRALYALAYQKVMELIRAKGESATWSRLAQS